MKVLAVHNRYLLKGGEDECFELENRLLRDRGHHVVEFVESNEQVAHIGPIQTALRSIWSVDSHRRLREMLRSDSFDIVHVHNFFPLHSPSVYFAAHAEGVPVVQTLRNYRLLCPSAVLYREGRACEDCLGKFVPWPGVAHACYRDSRAATAAVAAMLTLHRLLRAWSRKVDVYVALTEFARQKFIQGGLPAEKVEVRADFVEPDPGPGRHNDSYALFVGRLSPEKGIDTLLRAWAILESELPLKIAGDGPLADEVARGAGVLPAVEWLGRQSADRVVALMKEAKLLVFPSGWYEGMPRVIMEAFATALPVVASNLGSMSQMIEAGRTGLLFKPSDAPDLAKQVSWARKHPQELAAMGRNARSEYLEKYSASRSYDSLLKIYRRAIGRHTDTGGHTVERR